MHCYFFSILAYIVAAILLLTTPCLSSPDAASLATSCQSCRETWKLWREIEEEPEASASKIHILPQVREYVIPDDANLHSSSFFSLLPDINISESQRVLPSWIFMTFHSVLDEGNTLNPLPSFSMSSKHTIDIQPISVHEGAYCLTTTRNALFPVPSMRTLNTYFLPEEFDAVEDTFYASALSELDVPHTSTAVRKNGNANIPFTYNYKTDLLAFNTGISWINDISDAKRTPHIFQKSGFDSLNEKIPGVNLNLGASYRAISVTGGYIHAIDRYGQSQASLFSNDRESGAWSSEVAYSTELLRKTAVLAVGYQNSSDSLRLYLPKQRYTTKASLALAEGTSISIEYYLDKDYSLENGSLYGDGYGFTTKIGFDFQ